MFSLLWLIPICLAASLPVMWLIELYNRKKESERILKEMRERDERLIAAVRKS
ncbi:MAG: hypothetical protein L0I62_06530 [Gammaproteobacteria bacterium]|nr:hypothetical protein [Gammaproteobacteria bacterium]